MVGTNDASAQRKFRNKYHGVKLIRKTKGTRGSADSEERRFVLGVEFDEIQKVWMVVTDVESELQHSQQASADSEAPTEHVLDLARLKINTHTHTHTHTASPTHARTPTRTYTHTRTLFNITLFNMAAVVVRLW